MTRCLNHCFFLGLLVGLALLLVEARGEPTSKEPIRKEQVQEIEKYLGQVDEGDRPAQYMVYVVVTALGIIAGLVVLRRLLLN